MNNPYSPRKELENVLAEMNKTSRPAPLPKPIVSIDVNKDELRAILAEMNRAYAFKNHPIVNKLYPKLQKIWEENYD